MRTNIYVNGLELLEATAVKLCEKLEAFYGGSDKVLYSIFPTAVPYKPKDTHFRFCAGCIRIGIVAQGFTHVFYLTLFMRKDSSNSLTQLSSIRLISAEDFKNNLCYKVKLDEVYAPCCYKEYQKIVDRTFDTYSLAYKIAIRFSAYVQLNYPKEVL